MCDKYIRYVYACLRAGKAELSEDELAYLFGTRGRNLRARLHPQWLEGYRSRCRDAYERERRRRLRPSPLSISNASSLYAARLGDGALITADEDGRLLSIQRFAEPRPPRRLRPADSAFAVFRETLSVFSDVAFRALAGGGAEPALVISKRSEIESGGSSHWWPETSVGYEVEERDVSGAEVVPGIIYASDGLSLYQVVSSWKARVCLVFSPDCREEVVRTLCALALGDCGLGTRFALRCVLPGEGDRAFDLRELEPKDPWFPGPALGPGASGRQGFLRELDGTAESRHGAFSGLAALREVISTPLAFSVLAENDHVAVLRHLLRDALVIVPKSSPNARRGTGRQDIAGVSRGGKTTARETREAESKSESRLRTRTAAEGPSGRLTEWFPSGHSVLEIETGAPGAPRLLISSPKVVRGNSRSPSASRTPTLRVYRTPRYSGVMPQGFRSEAYLFDRAVCLIPGGMDVIAPPQLDGASCAAVLYALEVFAKLAGPDVPTSLWFSGPLEWTEARALVLSYLRMENAGFERGSRESSIRFEASDCSILSKLRQIVSEHVPGTCPRLASLGPSESPERPMHEDLDGDLALLRGTPSRAPLSDARGIKEADPPARVDSPSICERTTGHIVLFGRGLGPSSRFKWVTIGIRTLGPADLNILRVCGVFHSRRGRHRALLKIPDTQGVRPGSRASGGARCTRLTEDLREIAASSTIPPPDCYFQLNYAPETGRERIWSRSGHELERFPLTADAASSLERAVRSDQARGYEERRLSRIFRSSRRTAGRCELELAVDEPFARGPCGGEPPHTRSWLRSPAADRQCHSAIGDGEFFPTVEVARAEKESSGSVSEDALSHPLREYNLNLAANARPKRFALDRADRCPGECGSAYEACLDEAVMLGHCARVLATRGAEKDFDVSACLTRFYRAVHPCVPEMSRGDVMLDYEFVLHGQGLLPPAHALLGHLAESCRLTCHPACKLFTLSRHRGASAWTRGTDAEVRHSRSLRVNTIGAFLCSRDHRLAPLLARCCEPRPLSASELCPGSELLPRGDEEDLLLRAYSETLGPALVFERVETFPGRVSTSLGDWSFLRLASEGASRPESTASARRPGMSVIDGHTVAFASESPLFYLRGKGPLVQRLESVAVVAENCSLFRTDALTNEDPAWPAPEPLEARARIKCLDKASAIDKMFMRRGRRDPLEGYATSESSWERLKDALWTFAKVPAETSRPSDWERDYPVSRSSRSAGPEGAGVEIVRWLCGAPPEEFTHHGRPGEGLGRVEMADGHARALNPREWRGFDVLRSRVLTCPSERRWTRGLCVVTNRGTSRFQRESRMPISSLIEIAEPGRWYAKPVPEDDGREPEADGEEELESWSFRAEVSSAGEFADSLARAMLSGNTHAELEIRCSRRGLYGYLQRAVAWFAGATGPFRSRAVTVYTPEADSQTFACRWTHALPRDLDVLRSRRTGYLVSRPDGPREDDAIALLVERSKGVIPVRHSGNLVLHSEPRTLRAAAIRGDPGLHVLVSAPEDAEPSEEQQETLRMRNKDSLMAFCEMNGVPGGIRGPETWKDPSPWSKRQPGSFCSKVAELKFRWESGTEAPLEAPARGPCEWLPRLRSSPPRWQRSPDGRLVLKRDRFWHSVDTKASLVEMRRRAASLTLNAEAGNAQVQTERAENDEDERVEEEEDEEEEEEDQDLEGVAVDEGEEGDPAVPTPAPLRVKCDFRERGLSSILTLNSRLEIELVPDVPAVEGHVFFAPAPNPAWKRHFDLTERGKLVRYYRPCSFSPLTYHVHTVLTFGCGLRPVFEHGSADPAGDKILDLVLCALALGNVLSTDAPPGRFGVTLVVRGGRGEMLKRARELSRCVIVTKAGAYEFEELPKRLDRELAASPSSSSYGARPVYGEPRRFLSESGAATFAQLTTLWPQAGLRSDVKHPSCSGDPRWIGLMVCLAEWQGHRLVANALVPGALEALMAPEMKREP
uniref:Uncharacterized protein n=1 Tax=Oryzias latipes TaxID=8090 RepID=A0A286P9X7_ORYLA|nr:hypothetical protein [Oryzias latipes]